MNTVERIANIFLNRREQLDLTRAAVLQRMGEGGNNYLQKLENGLIKSPGVLTVERVANALGLRMQISLLCKRCDEEVVNGLHMCSLQRSRTQRMSR